MDLQTGRMSQRGHCKKCKMTKLVIDTVNKMAYRQGYKSLKFLDCKKKPMLLNHVDTLDGIGAMINENVKVLEQADETYMPMVPLKSQEDDDSKLIVNLGADTNELADLLNNGHSVNDNAGKAAPADDNV